MTSPRQKICKALGSEGCYFLCIVHLAEGLISERIDAVLLYSVAIAAGLMEEDCFVNEPAKLLMMMAPGKWEMVKYGMDYVPKDGEHEITRYERTTTAGALCHFVCTDRRGNVVYDPLGGSLCVKLGKPVSKRVFRKVA
jgi:hypothetical protein